MALKQPITLFSILLHLHPVLKLDHEQKRQSSIENWKINEQKNPQTWNVIDVLCIDPAMHGVILEIFNRRKDSSIFFASISSTWESFFKASWLPTSFDFKTPLFSWYAVKQNNCGFSNHDDLSREQTLSILISKLDILKDFGFVTKHLENWSLKLIHQMSNVQHCSSFFLL